MDWIQQAVMDFGASMGLEELEFDADSGVELTLDSGELLGIAYLPESPFQEMLVYTTAPLQFDRLRQMEAALRLSNARYNLCGPVQTGIQDGRLIMAMRLPAREFDLPLLDQAVSCLLEMHRKVASAV